VYQSFGENMSPSLGQIKEKIFPLYAVTKCDTAQAKSRKKKYE
jgi:hypothetical protein